MSDLRKSIIRLAHENPELRSALLPVLRTAGSVDQDTPLNDLPEDLYESIEDAVKERLHGRREKLRSEIELVEHQIRDLDRDLSWVGSTNFIDQSLYTLHREHWLDDFEYRAFLREAFKSALTS